MSEFRIQGGGETIVEYGPEGHAIAEVLKRFETGERVKTATVGRNALANAIGLDLDGSETKVHIHCDGDRLAVTDHKWEEHTVGMTPLANRDDGGIVREESIRTRDPTQRTKILRDVARETLLAMEPGDITVSVVEDKPLILEDDEKAVGIAPCLPPLEDDER